MAVDLKPFEVERHRGPVGLYSQFMRRDYGYDEVYPWSCKPARQQFDTVFHSSYEYHNASFGSTPSTQDAIVTTRIIL